MDFLPFVAVANKKSNHKHPWQQKENLCYLSPLGMTKEKSAGKRTVKSVLGCAACGLWMFSNGVSRHA